VIDHKGWCNINQSDDARGSMSVNRTKCDCGADKHPSGDGCWRPHREANTEVGPGWHGLIDRLDLKRSPEDRHFVLHGQDGWAFGAAVRFQVAAHDLAKESEGFYWSGYHLLALIIERARVDLTFLEAIEALAVATLSDEEATKQLKQLGVWP